MASLLKAQTRAIPKWVLYLPFSISLRTFLLEIEEESKNQGIDFPQRQFELEEHIDCLDTVNHWLNAVIINVSIRNLQKMTILGIDKRKLYQSPL